MHILANKIPTVLDQSDFERALAQMEPEKRARVLAMRDSLAIRQTVCADRLIRSVLVREYGLIGSAVQFVSDAFGKPRLVNTPDIHFNLSHAGEWVVAVIDDRPVGIDIERIIPEREFPFMDVFSPRERAQWDNGELSPEEQTQFFFTLWTGKESYVKALGRGMRFPFETISVLPVPTDGVLQLDDPVTDTPWYARWYPFAPDYTLAVCATHAEFPERIVRFTHREVFS